MTTQQCEECFDLFATASEYLAHKAEQHNESVFMDTLSPSIKSRAEASIKENLYADFCEGIDNDEPFFADRKWAGLSDSKEVMEAFNKFYDLKEGDPEYLD